jgi:chromosome segregation ATPase
MSDSGVDVSDSDRAKLANAQALANTQDYWKQVVKALEDQLKEQERSSTQTFADMRSEIQGWKAEVEHYKKLNIEAMTAKLQAQNERDAAQKALRESGGADSEASYYRNVCAESDKIIDGLEGRVNRLNDLVIGLAERVVAQSECLSRAAEHAQDAPERARRHPKVVQAPMTVCNGCGGSGRISVPSNNQDPHSYYRQCQECKGTGCVEKTDVSQR